MTPLFWLKWVRRGLALLLLAGVALVGVTSLRVYLAGQRDSRRPSDVILVLGASQFDGRPSAVFAARLDHAKVLYDAHVAAHVLTVGGNQPGDRFTEGQAGANYLIRKGIPSSALVVVGEGRDTLLSLRAAKRAMASHGWTTAVIVSDRWHMLRSTTMARDLGIRNVGSPVGTGPSVHGLMTQVRYVGRETLAYLYYVAFHRASEPGPPAV